MDVVTEASEYLENEESPQRTFLPAGTTSPLTPLAQVAQKLEGTPGFEQIIAHSTAPENDDLDDVKMSSSRTLYEKMGDRPGNDPLSVLSDDMRAMVTAVNRLRAVGLEDLGLPLPRIAVIGNQSAGKSSLIEAISGITVPRYTGTCTRCPLEINLTENNEPGAYWTCKVSLRLQKHLDKKSRRVDPWVHQNQEIVPFREIYEKAHVEDVLVRAQTAILNPSSDWRLYADSPDGGKRNQPLEVKFSPNVVCMDISGPNLPNLAFIDLPGLIQNTDMAEESYMIKLVRSLVEFYIKQDDCLILLAITMKDDAANQSAVRMAKDFGRGRTIGALTKPDTVLEGEHDQWIDILTNKTHQLPHGYFVTKQPSQDQLVRTMSHQDARAQEEQFFSTTEPWCTNLAEFSDKFGTLKLQQYLSRQLISLIKLRLPEISERVQRESFEVQNELDTLPSPPADNACLLLSHNLHKFEQTITELLDGSHLRNIFRSQWQKVAELLQKSLKELRPRVNMNDRAALEPASPFALRDGGLRRLFSDAPSPSPAQRRRVGEVPDAPADDFWISGSSRKRARTVDEGDNDRESTVGLGGPPSEDIPKSKPMHLQEIKSIIDSTATSRIPEYVDPKAVEALVKIHVLLWKEPLEEFVSSTMELLHSHISEIFAEHFSRYRMSQLYLRIPDILEGYLRMIHARLNTAIDTSFNRELHNVLTMNEDEMAREKASARVAFNNRRNNELEAQSNARKAAEEEKNRQQSGNKRQRVDLAARPEVDKFAREIETMAGVCAYMSITRRQFLDHVVKCVQGDIFYSVKQTMREHVEIELGMQQPDAEEICKRLMIEDPEKEARRRELLDRKEKLDSAWLTLRSFQN